MNGNSLKVVKEFSKDEYNEKLSKLAREIINVDKQVVWVSTSRLASDVKKIVGGIKQPFIIDTVSMMFNAPKEEDERVSFVSSPAMIDEINDRVAEVVKNNKGDSLVVVDSLNSLLMYNSLGRITKLMRNFAVGFGNTDVICIVVKGGEMIERLKEAIKDMFVFEEA